ncbi:MAG: hypothetical protein WB787_06525, partial [Candidatus Acidiferrales bacterium]
LNSVSIISIPHRSFANQLLTGFRLSAEFWKLNSKMWMAKAAPSQHSLAAWLGAQLRSPLAHGLTPQNDEWIESA